MGTKGIFSVHDGHGTTQREQQILDLHEADLSHDQIAASLGVKAEYVKWVVDTFHRPKMTDWQTPAIAASEMLAAALRRHHPERCVAWSFPRASSRSRAKKSWRGTRGMSGQHR